MLGISRTFIPFIVVPVVSLLVFNGTVTRACEAEVNAALTEVLGTVILLGTMMIGAFHSREIKKIEAATPENEEHQRFTRLHHLAGIVKSAIQHFVYKKPPQSI